MTVPSATPAPTFDDNRNLAVILTVTGTDPEERYYFARRGNPKDWKDVTDEVTVLNRALKPPPGARLRGSLSQGRRITFDNEKFNEPTDGRWVRLAVRHTDRLQDTLGGEGDRRFRSSGSVFVQVFTEVGDRMLVADCIAQAIVDVFDAVTFNVEPNEFREVDPTPSLTFEAATSRESGAEGKWNMVIVEAPFSYDEIR